MKDETEPVETTDVSFTCGEEPCQNEFIALAAATQEREDREEDLVIATALRLVAETAASNAQGVEADAQSNLATAQANESQAEQDYNNCLSNQSATLPLIEQDKRDKAADMRAIERGNVLGRMALLKALAASMSDLCAQYDSNREYRAVRKLNQNNQ